MPDITAIQNTPDVSFIDNKTIDDVRGDMVADFEAFMLQATGSKVSLGRASVHRMILYSAAAQIYQAMQYVDRAGKQSLLKYSYSEFLDNLALLKGVTREPAKAATTTIRFTASATRTLATPIPAGTRVSSSGSIYFSTVEYAEIPAGSLTVDVLAECTATGDAGNGLAPGEVSTIVDPVPYITSAVNQNTTEGGADVENDESLAERVYLAPWCIFYGGTGGRIPVPRQEVQRRYWRRGGHQRPRSGPGGYCFHHGRRFQARRGHDLRPAGVPLQQDDPPHDGQVDRESTGGGHIQH